MKSILEGVIAQMYVDDFATFIWEILRLRRYGTAIIINNSRLATLQRILEQLLCHRNCDRPYSRSRRRRPRLQLVSQQKCSNESCQTAPPMGQ